MSQLDSSWDLEDRLKTADCTDELKKEINDFIANQHERCVGKARSVSNLYYRCNLHYIEDNISKDSLTEELRKFNEQLKSHEND